MTVTDAISFYHFAAASLSGGQAADKEKESRFLDLIRKEDSLISAICFSYASSAADYDDLRQDAFVNIWRGIDSFRGDSSDRTWLYRVVINSCVSTVRKCSRHRKADVDLSTLYNLIGDEPSGERERIEALHKMISTLNPEEKAIIMLWLDEAPYDEIAEVMGISANNVAVRLHRIRGKLARLAPGYL